MLEYMKHRKSLVSKSKSKDKSKKAGDATPYRVRSRSSSEASSAVPSGSGGSSSVNPLTEDRVAQLTATHMASLSESFATSMKDSFANIQSMIDDMLASYSQVSNPSFSVPSPGPIRSYSSQGQQNTSMPCSCARYGPRGGVEEPVLA